MASLRFSDVVISGPGVALTALGSRHFIISCVFLSQKLVDGQNDTRLE